MAMTRCLNCGSDRSADQCDSCGLTSIAAELLLRRRLLNRTAVFLVGALAFVVASQWYPPLELDGILIFVGSLFFLTLGLATWVERRALQHAEVEALKRVFYGLVPVPWLLGALLFANGQFDRAKPVEMVASVVGKFALRAPLPSRRLIVTSWREGHTVERVPVTGEEFSRFQRGDEVVVRLQEGLVGIPWVGGVDRK